MVVVIDEVIVLVGVDDVVVVMVVVVVVVGVELVVVLVVVLLLLGSYVSVSSPELAASLAAACVDAADVAAVPSVVWAMCCPSLFPPLPCASVVPP